MQVSVASLTVVRPMATLPGQSLVGDLSFDSVLASLRANQIDAAPPGNAAIEDNSAVQSEAEADAEDAQLAPLNLDEINALLPIDLVVIDPVSEQTALSQQPGPHPEDKHSLRADEAAPEVKPGEAFAMSSFVEAGPKFGPPKEDGSLVNFASTRSLRTESGTVLAPIVPMTGSPGDGPKALQMHTKTLSQAPAFSASAVLPSTQTEAFWVRMKPIPAEPGNLAQPEFAALGSAGSFPPNHAPATGAAFPTPIARQLADQIVLALPRLAEGAVEIQLHPQELGRVKMQMSISDVGVVLTIHAERPETADLMRRYAGELGADLRELGFQDIDLSFSGGETFGTEKHEDADHTGILPREDIEMDFVPALRGYVGLVTTGLDIRL